MTLIERLEAASGPDRTLDGAIQRAMGQDWPIHFSGCGVANAFSTSIDAAMTLVPEGWHTFLATEDRHSHSWGWELRGGFGQKAHGRAPTPALALCIASLKARGVS